jgi:hypothetical protein
LNPKFFRNGIVMLVLVVGTAALLFTWINSTTPSTPIGYSQFLSDVQSDRVDSVVQQGETLTVKLKGASTTYTVTVPSVLTQVLNDMSRRPSQQRHAQLRHLQAEPRPIRRGSACSRPGSCRCSSSAASSSS